MRVACGVLLACALTACAGETAPPLDADVGEVLLYHRQISIRGDDGNHISVAQHLKVTVESVAEDELVLDVACERALVWIGKLARAAVPAEVAFDSADETLRGSGDFGTVYAETWGDAALVRARVTVGRDAIVRGVELLAGRAETGDEEEDANHAVLASALSHVDEVVTTWQHASSRPFSGLGPRVRGDLKRYEGPLAGMGPPGERSFSGDGVVDGPHGELPVELGMMVARDGRGWVRSSSSHVFHADRAAPTPETPHAEMLPDISCEVTRRRP